MATATPALTSAWALAICATLIGWIAVDGAPELAPGASEELRAAPGQLWLPPELTNLLVVRNSSERRPLHLERAPTGGWIAELLRGEHGGEFRSPSRRALRAASTTRVELLAPPGSTLASILAHASYAATEGTARERGDCAVLFAIHPHFDELRAATIAAVDASCAPPANQDCTLYFGANLRQFLPEMLLAAYFADHPCRTPWPADATEPPAAAGSPVPILHIIALPVRTISLLAARQAAPLRERLSALLSALVASRPFQLAPERHVLLHTSTAKMTYVFGAKCAQTLERARGIMTLSFEGPGGDKRLGAHVATEKTIVVPYFIEPPALIDLGLAAIAAGSVPPTFAAEFAREREYAGVGARVYMRASSGAAYGQGLRNLRSTLGSLFERERGADVRLRPRLDQQNHGTQQAAFYATMAAMRNSTFCLIPRGMTATSRRLYESLACGCVPVLISDDFLLPFQATHGQLWQAAVLRQPEAELAQLPARLRAITPEQVRAMRQAGASLLPALTYIVHARTGVAGNGVAPASSVAAADGQATGASASRLILAQLQTLALGATSAPAAASSSLAQLAPPAVPSVVPADLAEAVSRAGVLVLTVCSASDSAAYTVGQKRATGAQECIRWLRSLRRAGYAGPVAILASTRSSALRSHLASAAGASGSSAAGGGGSDSASSGGTWLIDKLEQRLPRTPPLAGVSRPPALSGNQLRLAWYMHTMAALEQAAPSARVLAVDARDVYFQAEPIAALESAASALSQGARCGLVFIADCRSCAALADDYFRRQGVRCLSPSALDAIGSTNPPLNGGVVLGTPPLLLKLYSTAARLAVAQDDECRAMGRDQHLLTAAGFELQREARQQALAPVCLLRNDASLQAAVANLGVNNDVRGMFSLDQKSGLIESVALRQPIALLHQFDRRKEMKAFVLKHYEASI